MQTIVEQPSRLWRPRRRKLWVPDAGHARPGRRRRLWSPETEPLLVTLGYVQGNYSENEPSSSPVTVTLSGTTAGNLLCIIGLAQGNVGTLTFGTPSDGANTYHACTGTAYSGIVNTNENDGAAFYAANIAGGSVTITVPLTNVVSGVFVDLFVFEVSGATTYAGGAFGVGSATNAVTSPFTTTYPTIICCACATELGPGTVGPGYTAINLNTSAFNWAYEYGVFAAGSQVGQVNGEGDGSHSWGIVAAAFGTPSTATGGFWAG